MTNAHLHRASTPPQREKATAAALYPSPEDAAGHGCSAATEQMKATGGAAADEKGLADDAAASGSGRADTAAADGSGLAGSIAAAAPKFAENNVATSDALECGCSRTGLTIARQAGIWIMHLPCVSAGTTSLASCDTAVVLSGFAACLIPAHWHAR